MRLIKDGGYWLIKEGDKMIASLNPEDNLLSIIFSDEVIAEWGNRLGIVINLGKQKAEDSWISCDGCDENDEYFWKNGFRSGYNSGYNQALSDNKDKLFTLEDMKIAFIRGMRYVGNSYEGTLQLEGGEEFNEKFNKCIQSLSKQEYEVELDNDDWNNSVKVIKIK